MEAGHQSWLLRTTLRHFWSELFMLFTKLPGYESQHLQVLVIKVYLVEAAPTTTPSLP